MSRAMAITNVRIFDGERAISDTTVVVGGARIEAVGPSVPRDAVVVDGRGATLMPGTTVRVSFPSLQGQPFGAGLAG